MSFPKTDFSELKRRQGVVKTGLSQTPADVDTVKPSLLWNDPSQRFALINLANREQKPKSVFPAFRVLGFFPSVEVASEFGRLLAPQIRECNIFLVESCKWNLVPLSAVKTPEESRAKVESLLIAYYKELVFNKLDFDSRRAENTATVVEENVFENPAYPVAVRELEKRGVTLESVTALLEERQSQAKQERLVKLQAMENAEEKKLETPHVTTNLETPHVTTNLETPHVTTQPAASTSTAPEGKVEFTETMLRSDEDSASNLVPTNQRHLIFSVMQDENEPAFCLYGALPTLQESKGFLHFVLKTEAPTHDNNCADMGVWIYPESLTEMERLGLATYPLDEQNRIMQWNRESKNRTCNMDATEVLADRVLDTEGNVVDLPVKEADLTEETKN